MFLFYMFKFVVVAAPNRADAPTSQIYVTVQCNPFRHTKVKVLNLGVTPPYFVLKSTNRTAQFFLFFKL